MGRIIGSVPDHNIDKVLEKYPRKRNELPDTYRKIYDEHYMKNRAGATAASSVAQRMESWMHKKTAAGLSKSDYDGMRMLEIGAGTLNHLSYVPSSVSYSIVEPYEYLFKTSPHAHRISMAYADISDIPAEVKYDQIVSIATFEHVCSLPEVVAHAGLHLSNPGQLRVAIPSEGTLLWYLGWKLTTGLEFRLRRGLNYSVLMKYEHVNTAREIEQILAMLFREVKVRVFGIAKSISFYRYYECSSPDIERCKYVKAYFSSTLSDS